MKVTTNPGSRLGWQGQSIEYVVKAEGATQITGPEKPLDGLNVRIVDQRRVDGGVEAKVAVDIVRATEDCNDIRLMARDATGASQQVPLALAAVPFGVLPGAAIVGTLAVAGTVMAFRMGGWAGRLLGIVGVLLALGGLGFLAAMLYGRYSGFPWGATA